MSTSNDNFPQLNDENIFDLTTQKLQNGCNVTES